MSAPLSPRRSSQRRLWLGLGGSALVVLCLCLALGVGGGVALYLSRNQPVSEGASVEYVLDVSPRMALPGESGTPRLTVARGVLAEIVRPADSANLAGLRVFGTGAVKQTCQDTNLLVPLTQSSQKLISDKASALEVGLSTDSPLAQAIVAAMRDLAAKKGSHSLVVVTGGADSCNPNAAQVVAQEAKRSGIDLETYVVGFGVSDSEAQAIKVLVDQTPKARYLDAKDEARLRLTLQGVQDRIEHPATSYVGQSACDYPYNPLREGATWEYAMAGRLYSETVTAVTGGVSQATVTEAYDDGSSQGTFVMTCSPDGIEDFQTQTGAAGQDAGAQVTMTSHSGWTLVPPGTLAPGSTWESSVEWSMSVSQGGQTLTTMTVVTNVYTAVGVENVTTRAGTFEAIRVDAETTSTSTMPPQVGGSDDFTQATASSSTLWYARGVGLVKMAGTGSASWVQELVAYFIPGMPNASRTAFIPPAAMVAATPTATPGPAIGSLLGDFPIYPGATLDPAATSQEEDHGQFRLKSGDALNQVNQFYGKELPARGWSLGPVMVTTSGGPIERWSKDNLRLQLFYMPADQGQTPETNLTGVYNLLDPAQARAFLPPDFPLPDGTEFIEASYDQVDLYVPQDYAAVVAFYLGKQAALAARGWTQGNQTPIDASCGDPDGCGDSSNPNWPAGTTPMPWPTADPRGRTALSWIAPNKDEFLIEIVPYQQNTHLSVAITFKDPANAHLPPDVPVYQGAVIQMVLPGMLTFQAPASVEVVSKFYDNALTAAGWQVESEQVLKMWKKGALEISVMVMDAGGTLSSVTIMCTGCTAP